MKKFIVILFIAVLFAGCSKSKNIQICEWVTASGDGVTCGSKFSTGDLTVLIKNSEPFGVSSITVKVFAKKNNKGLVLVETVPLYVKPESRHAYTTISFAEAGNYTLKAVGKEDDTWEATVEIIDL